MPSDHPHFPTFRNGATGLMQRIAQGIHTERGWLRGTLYVILTVAALDTLAMRIAMQRNLVPMDSFYQSRNNRVFNGDGIEQEILRFTGWLLSPHDPILSFFVVLLCFIGLAASIPKPSHR